MAVNSNFDLMDVLTRHDIDDLIRPGAMTNTGRWVGRAEAATIALAAGQTAKLRFSSRDLYSEDLW